METSATSCHIGYVINDTAIYIRCTNNGYLSQTGRLLLRNYNSFEKARELVWLGDIRSLRNTLNKTKGESYFVLNNKKVKTMNIKNVHTLIEENIRDLLTEFTYLFIDGKWYVSLDFVDNRDLQKGTKINLQELTKELIEKESIG